MPVPPNGCEIFCLEGSASIKPHGRSARACLHKIDQTRIGIGDQSVAPRGQIGRDLDLHPDQLRKWARELGEWRSEPSVASPDPVKMTDPERENEIRRLRRELERVKQERDFLKKATAFFAKESH